MIRDTSDRAIVIVIVAVLVLGGLAYRLLDRQSAKPSGEPRRSPTVEQTSPPPEPQETSQGQREDRGVVCDTFEIRYSLSGDQLSVSLVTDLPDFTDIMFSVSRLYREKGDNQNYVLDYHSEKSTVRTWRSTRTIDVSDAVFRRNMDEKQKMLAQLGEPFEVGSIDEHVEVSFTVPINQDHPAFGKRNEHLSGTRVAAEGLRVVREEVQVPRALGGRAPTSAWANPRGLRVGTRYSLSEGAPLMPEFEPADPLRAVGEVVTLPDDSVIRVVSVREKTGEPWYEVEAFGPTGQAIGEGWINSTALIGQDVKEAR